MSRAWLAAAAAAGLAHSVPAVTARGPLHRVLPRLHGVGRPGGIALTFDDGPHHDGTPAVLDALSSLGWRATFFALGSQVRAHPALARRLLAEGHEIAVHGDAHRNHLGRMPHAVHRDLQCAQDAILAATGTKARWFRPPYGVLSAGSLAAARRLHLTPVLWTAWGRDWRRTGARAIADTVCGDLRERGTVLLHDSDVTSVPGSWRATSRCLPLLAEWVAERGWEVRTLSRHLDPL